jgi:hypothetical protein
MCWKGIRYAEKSAKNTIKFVGNSKGIKSDGKIKLMPLIRDQTENKNRQTE